MVAIDAGAITRLRPGYGIWFGSLEQQGVVLDCVHDEYGFRSIYLVQLESGQVVALHEDRLVAAGILDRTVH